MLTNNLSDVALGDVQRLCDNCVEESRFLEFKAERIGGGNDDKREFLADVSAFANASGGDLVLGVKEEKGAAVEVCGIEVDDPDKEKRRLANIIQDCLEPRIYGPEIKWLPMPGTTRGVMVVRVPRSWSAPHRVRVKDMNFYVRDTNGKHPMSADELRQAFTFSASFAERMRAFRDGRMHAIETYQLPFDVSRGPKLAVLAVPSSAMLDPLEINIRDPRIINCITPRGPWDRQYCLEGVAIKMGDPVGAYSMVFRTGVVEFVSPVGLNPEWHRIQRIVFEAWKQFIAFAEKLDVRPPTSVFVTLIEVGGVTLSVGHEFAARPTPSRQNVVQLPEVYIGLDDFEKPPAVLFKRLLGVAGNAFGLESWPTWE
jgi:schlafen family protein